MAALIAGIGSANPPHRWNPAQVLDFIFPSLDSPRRRRLFEAVMKDSGITSRYSVLAHDATYEGKQFSLTCSTKERQEIYNLEINTLAIRSVEDLATRVPLGDITDIITVTCTGFTNPGFDQAIQEHFGLARTVNKYCLGFMGCYAALPALELASALISYNSEARVLVVCAEICSIHAKAETMDDLLSAALFADGAAAVLLVNREQCGEMRGLDIINHHTILIPAKDELAWEVGNYGYDIKLSSYVSKILALNFTVPFPELQGVEDLAYIIHPGGKSILDRIEPALGSDSLQLSRQILRQYGNMSSPTVLFALKEYFYEDKINLKSLLVAAFGPGLTAKYLHLIPNQ